MIRTKFLIPIIFFTFLSNLFAAPKIDVKSAILIDYNSDEISYESLLEVFFLTHNPTTLNRQGYDVGTQYRSAIFYTSQSQKETAEQYISFLESSKVFSDMIVTTVAPLDVFYDAEENHHDYYDQNSQQSYCQFVISPKIKLLNQRFKQKLKSDET